MSTDIRGHEALHHHLSWATRAQELCESRGGCPGLPVPNNPHGFCGRKATPNQNESWPTELRGRVKVEEAVLDSPSLLVLTVSVDVKQH